jgi:3-phenylpropionate/trans-cinnamate dioxygenase ferredoxin component
MSWYPIGDVSTLEIDKPISVEIDNEPVLVVRTEKGIYALSDTCSHAEVSLAEGTVSDGKIECWMHGAQFDLETGEALCLPATKGIEKFKVRIGNESSNTEVEVSINNQEQI